MSVSIKKVVWATKWSADRETVLEGWYSIHNETCRRRWFTTTHGNRVDVVHTIVEKDGWFTIDDNIDQFPSNIEFIKSWLEIFSETNWSTQKSTLIGSPRLLFIQHKDKFCHSNPKRGSTIQMVHFNFVLTLNANQISYFSFRSHFFLFSKLRSI